jgi:hypothetical protein
VTLLASYFRISDQEDARTTSERYIAKSNTDILIASTPNMPGGLMERIQNETNSLYNKIYLPYQVALGSVFSMEEIKEQMKSPSFSQEYELKYLSGIGNLFNIQEVDNCIQSYPLDDTINTSSYYQRWCGIDPGWGKDSTFAIIIIQWKDNKAQIVYHFSAKNPLYEAMIRQINRLIFKYKPCIVFIDGSAANVCKSLAYTHGDTPINYDTLKADKLKSVMKRVRYGDCRAPLVVPIPFSTEHENMLRLLQTFISTNKLRIHPSMEEVTVSLKSSKEQT